MPKSETDEQDDAQPEKEPAATEEGTGEAGKPAVDPAAAAVATIQPTGNEQVDKLVQAALAEALPKALNAALETQRANEARRAREKTLREQGDYKALFEASEEKRKALELDKWRGEALREAGLDNKWFDSIQGDTKEDMVAFAKKFKKHLDDEVAARAEMIVDEHPGTPRGGGKRARTRTDKLSGAEKTSHALSRAFGVNRLRTV